MGRGNWKKKDHLIAQERMDAQLAASLQEQLQDVEIGEKDYLIVQERTDAELAASLQKQLPVEAEGVACSPWLWLGVCTRKFLLSFYLWHFPDGTSHQHLRHHGLIPHVRTAFSAQDEVAELEVVLCVPGEADTDLVNSEQLRARLAVARRGG